MLTYLMQAMSNLEMPPQIQSTPSKGVNEVRIIGRGPNRRADPERMERDPKLWAPLGLKKKQNERISPYYC